MRQVIFDKKEQIPYGEHSLQISGEKLYFFALKKGQGVSRRRVGLGPLLDNVLVLVTICLLPELFDSSRQGGLAACGAHCGDDDTCFLLKNESATIGHLPDPFGCRRRGGEARQRVTKQDPAGARVTAGLTRGQRQLSSWKQGSQADSGPDVPSFVFVSALCKRQISSKKRGHLRSVRERPIVSLFGKRRPRTLFFSLER